MDWDKVENCNHEWSSYYDAGSCPTPYCSWSEKRCEKCGVYEIECGCGFENGLSGESRKKAMRRLMKKQGKEGKNDYGFNESLC